jgi:hypothetical protein
MKYEDNPTGRSVPFGLYCPRGYLWKPMQRILAVILLAQFLLLACMPVGVVSAVVSEPLLMCIQEGVESEVENHDLNENDLTHPAIFLSGQMGGFKRFSSLVACQIDILSLLVQSSCLSSVEQPPEA